MAKINYKIQVKNKTRFELKASGDTAVIKIIGEIDWYKNNSEEFCEQMEGLKAAGIKKLQVYLNSPGGSVYEANEIYNQIVAFDGEKSVQVGAICASAAMIILIAFAVENASCASNTMGMVHNPRVSVYDADETDLESSLNLLSKTKESLTALFAKRTGMSETQMSNKMDSTWWMTAADLKQYGFVAKISGVSDLLPEDTTEVVNKYRFEHVPDVINKAIAPSEPPKTKKTINNMKNFLVLLVTAIHGLKDKFDGAVLNSEEPAEASIVAGLSKFFQEKEEKITDLTNKLKLSNDQVSTLTNKVKEQDDAVIKATLDMAEESQKITKDQRKEFEGQVGKLGLDGLNAILNSMKPRTNLRNALELNHAAGNTGGAPGQGQKQELPKPKNMAEMMARRIAELNAKDANYR